MFWRRKAEKSPQKPTGYPTPLVPASTRPPPPPPPPYTTQKEHELAQSLYDTLCRSDLPWQRKQHVIEMLIDVCKGIPSKNKALLERGGKGSNMEIIVKAEPKEAAAFVLALQERRSTCVKNFNPIFKSEQDVSFDEFQEALRIVRDRQREVTRRV